MNSTKIYHWTVEDSDIFLCYNDKEAYTIIKRGGILVVSIRVIDEDPNYFTVFCDDGPRADEVTNLMFGVCSRMDSTGTKFLFAKDTFDEHYTNIIETFLNRQFK